MKITLQKLSIKNFKGIQFLEIDFSNETNVFGANGSGKTTIVDAYRWLLTGKDSFDRKDFEVKPTDKAGKPLSKTENEVSAVIEVDGRKITFARVNREKWVTKRGSSIEEFQGNETKFFYNEVPLSQKEYQAKVAEIFDEAKMKLLTDPTYFVLGLKWQDRRTILTEMAGGITDAMVLEQFSTTNSQRDVEFIKALIADKKSFEERRKELANKRKLAKDEKELIPSRIDEVKRNMPEALDFVALRTQASKLAKEISNFDIQISDRNKAHEAAAGNIETKRQQLFDLQSKLSAIEQKHRLAFEQETNNAGSATKQLEQDLSNLKSQIAQAQSNIETLTQRIINGKSSIANSEAVISTKTAQKADLLTKWKEKNAEQLTFDESTCKCPTCNQQLPDHDIESRRQAMLQSFADAKAKALRALENDAANINAQIDIEHANIKTYRDVIESLNKQHEEGMAELEQLINKVPELEAKIAASNSGPIAEVIPVVARLMNDKEHLALLNDISVLKEELEQYKPVDVSDIIAQKQTLQTEINQLNTELAKEELIQKAVARREELINQEKELAQTIANYEAEEFAIQAFIKAKMQFVEDTVNGMFTIVKWRMFRDQINGGEEPCCDCLVDGVEFEKNLNTASRINAGIDIINALSKHYNISAPIFLDNRESVTNIIPTENQLVNLIVSGIDTKLRIETKALEVADYN